MNLDYLQHLVITASQDPYVVLQDKIFTQYSVNIQYFLEEKLSVIAVLTK